MTLLRAPLQAQLVQWLVQPGAIVRQGEVVAILEAMKMEHELRAPATVRVRELLHAPGDTVDDGAVLWSADPVQAGEVQAGGPQTGIAPSARGVRDDLQRVLDRHALTDDIQRPDAIA